jgi:hypothetical protein
MILFSFNIIRDFIRVHECANRKDDKDERKTVRRSGIRWRCRRREVLVVEMLEYFFVELLAGDWIVPVIFFRKTRKESKYAWSHEGSYEHPRSALVVDLS